MAKRFWLCKCGARLERTKQKCACGRKRPAPRKYVKAKPRHSYEFYCALNEEIHGVADESCGACGKPRTQSRHHDRDHDHRNGNPRGLLCGGNQGCNVLLASFVTPATARAIAYVKRADREPDAERWELLARYLERVEAHYRELAA